jgi:hypothetical protein
MNTYTTSEVRKKLSKLLDKAKKEGRVLIKRKDGSTFELKSIEVKKSPLNVKGVNINLDKDEIIDILKEVRNR